LKGSLVSSNSEAAGTQPEPSSGGAVGSNAVDVQGEAGTKALVIAAPRRETVDQVRASIEADRHRYADRCWTSVARDHPGLSPISFMLRLQIDGSGREVARGIAPAEPPPSLNDPDYEALRADSRTKATSELLACLERVVDLPVTIAPSSHAVDVVVPLELP
jgi:hypothetical protein